jgi:hypothetical protein
MRRFLIAAGFAAIAGIQAPAAAAQEYSPPRTPDGQPDLQGVWTNETITPLERPRNLADKPFYTPEEVAALEKQAAQRREGADQTRRSGDVGSYNQFWMDSGTKMVSSRQTSLVTHPADGRVPVKPEAEQIRDANEAQSGDAFEFMSPWDRCIARGVPGSFFPAGYNNAYQFIQTPGYVVIHSEMIHDARIIPLDGRPSLPSRVRTWTGQSRGRWEGHTLVVETTNFNGKGWTATNAASGRIKGIPQSESLRVVERFTRSGPGTISYEVTIEDPKYFTQPWKVAIPLERDDTYQIYEYACHEGNHAVPNILRGARANER